MEGDDRLIEILSLVYQILNMIFLCSILFGDVIKLQLANLILIGGFLAFDTFFAMVS